MIEYKETIEIAGNRYFDFSMKTLEEVFSGRHLTNIINDPENWQWSYVPINEDIKSYVRSEIEEAGDGNLVIISKNLAEQYGISGRRTQQNNVVKIPEKEYTSSLQERMLEAYQNNILGTTTIPTMAICNVNPDNLLEVLTVVDFIQTMNYVTGAEILAIKEGNMEFLRNEIPKMLEKFSDFLFNTKNYEDVAHIHRMAKQVRENWNRRVLEMVGDEVEDNIELVRVVPYSNRIVDALVGCYRNRKLKI